MSPILWLCSEVSKHCTVGMGGVSWHCTVEKPWGSLHCTLRKLGLITKLVLSFLTGVLVTMKVGDNGWIYLGNGLAFSAFNEISWCFGLVTLGKDLFLWQFDVQSLLIWEFEAEQSELEVEAEIGDFLFLITNTSTSETVRMMKMTVTKVIVIRLDLKKKYMKIFSLLQ